MRFDWNTFQIVQQLLFVTKVGAPLCPEIWRFLSVWESSESRIGLVPTGGLCYWLTTPMWKTLSLDKLRTFISITYVLLIYTTLSRIAIMDEDCHENPDNTVADLLGPTQITLATKAPNPDEALSKEVQRLVPTASILSGLSLGCICVVSDVFGVIGGGQGMLLASSIIYKGYELWVKERKALSDKDS